MAEETKTYQERLEQLNALRQECAKVEQELKRSREAELKQRKESTRNPNCENIINRYSLLSAFAGLLPIAMDAAALTGLQIKMIDDLAEQFGRNYTEAEGRHTLAALTAGLITPAIAAPSIASAVVLIPGVGPLFGLAASPVTAAAATRLIGRLAVEHFERDEQLPAVEAAKGTAAVGQSSAAESAH
ncbi:MAG: DUF697 domain-containing protein [Deltaproteobacteria bacterium]|nr:DUF697 domain-containing protein [Deltaproteobacteria bacterium]